MRVLLALLPLLFIAACAPDGLPRIHEVVLYGQQNTRITWFYGTPTTLMFGDQVTELTRYRGESEDALAIEGALGVGDAPYLRERIPGLANPPSEVYQVPRSSDMRVRVHADTGPILYYDGNVWFRLLGDGRPGIDVPVVPRPLLNGLQGLGELERREALALQEHFESLGSPVAVTLLDEIPAAPRAAAGAQEYLRTGLFVQTQFSALQTSAAPAQERLVWEPLQQGDNAAVTDESFRLIADNSSFARAWSEAHANLLQPPPLPEVDFTRERVVAIFLGSRPTGGHGVSVENVSQLGGELFVDVNVTEPAPDAIVTQALTSPWTMVRVLRGGFDYAWVRDAGSGQLLGLAQ